MWVFEINVVDFPGGGGGAVEGNTPVGIHFNAVAANLATQLLDVFPHPQTIAHITETVGCMQMHQDGLDGFRPSWRYPAHILASRVPETPHASVQNILRLKTHDSTFGAVD